jgi:hypothetical protein
MAIHPPKDGFTVLCILANVNYIANYSLGGLPVGATIARQATIAGQRPAMKNRPQKGGGC